MSEKITLTPDQVKALDTLIDKFKVEPDFIQQVANWMMARFAEAFGGPPSAQDVQHTQQALHGGKLTLEDLLELKKKANS